MKKIITIVLGYLFFCMGVNAETFSVALKKAFETNLELNAERESLNISEQELNISKERLKEAREYSNKKLEEIISYAYNRDECRSILLLRHFGENSKERCQICDYCVKENRKTLKQKDFEVISAAIIKLLEKRELSIDEIIIILKEIEEEKIQNVIQYLFDKDKISKHGNKYSRIKN